MLVITDKSIAVRDFCVPLNAWFLLTSTKVFTILYCYRFVPRSRKTRYIMCLKWEKRSSLAQLQTFPAVGFESGHQLDQERN